MTLQWPGKVELDAAFDKLGLPPDFDKNGRLKANFVSTP